MVLLHAFPLSSRIFASLVPLLAPDLRVVVVDLPGLGDSPVPDAEPSMTHVADGVVQVLDDVGLDRATLFGISTGGYAALQVAAQDSDRVDALALGSTTPWLVEPDVPADREQVADRVEAEQSVDAVRGSADEGIGSTAHAERPGLVDDVAAIIDAQRPDGVAWMARAIARRADTSDVLRMLERPVGLVFGSEDEATPPRRAAEMATLRPPARPAQVDVLDRTGHLTALERPDLVAAALRRLIAV